MYVAFILELVILFSFYLGYEVDICRILFGRAHTAPHKWLIYIIQQRRAHQ